MCSLHSFQMGDDQMYDYYTEDGQGGDYDDGNPEDIDNGGEFTVVRPRGGYQGRRVMRRVSAYQGSYSQNYYSDQSRGASGSGGYQNYGYQTSRSAPVGRQRGRMGFQSFRGQRGPYVARGDARSVIH